MAHAAARAALDIRDKLSPRDVAERIVQRLQALSMRPTAFVVGSIPTVSDRA